MKKLILAFSFLFLLVCGSFADYLSINAGAENNLVSVEGG